MSCTVAYCIDRGTPSERLVLVVPRMMRADLLKLSHGDPSSGHMGINQAQAIWVLTIA